MAMYNGCKNCGKPISDVETNFFTRSLPNCDLGRCLFPDTLIRKNVVMHKMLRTAGPHTVRDLHCAKCKYHIGYKFIEGPAPSFEEGDFLLIQEKLKQVPAEEAVDQDQAPEGGEHGAGSSAVDQDQDFLELEEQEADSSRSSEEELPISLRNLRSQQDAGQEVYPTEGDLPWLFRSQEDVRQEDDSTEGDSQSLLRRQEYMGQEVDPTEGDLQSLIRRQEDGGQEQVGCCSGIIGIGCCSLQ